MLQEQTKSLLFSIVYHSQLDIDCIMDDAVWYVGSVQTRLTKWDMPLYLEQNAIEMPTGTPEVTFMESGYMGSECISLVGELKYVNEQESTKQIRLSFHFNWVLENEQWKVRQLITTSRRFNTEIQQTYGEGGLDYRTLIRSLPFALICCSLDGNLPVQRISKRALALLGYESIHDYRHHVGATFMSAVHPEDIPAFIKYTDELRSGKPAEQIILRMRRKDFTYVQIQMYGTFVEEGWMVFACVDHTDHQNILDMIVQEKEALESRQSIYYKLIDNMPCGFYTCSLSVPRNVNFVSDSLSRMSGYSKEEREGIYEKTQPVHKIMVVPEDQQQIADAVRALMQYPHTEQVIYRMIRKDGSMIRVLERMRSVRDSEGKMQGYSLVLNLDDETLGQHLAGTETSPQQGRQTPAAALQVPPASSAASDEAGHKVQINTFGYFEVWIDGSPVAFRSAKARELLALLIDRRGNFTSRESIISALWEDEPVNSTTLARCRKTYMNLVTELRNYGVEDIVETENGMRRIIPEKVSCDLFDYLSGDKDALPRFNGIYLTEYPWSEMTLAALLNPREQ